MIGNLHSANMAISYRCLNPIRLTVFFFQLKLIGSLGRDRIGAILSTVEGAEKLHLLGYFDPFLTLRV